MHHGSQSVKIVKKGKVISTFWSQYFIASVSCQGLFIPHPYLTMFLDLEVTCIFTLIYYDSSQVFEMLTIVANLVTKFECSIWLLYPYPMLHSASCLE